MNVLKRKKIVFNDAETLAESLLSRRMTNSSVESKIDPLSGYELKSTIVRLIAESLTNELIEVNFNLSGNIMHIQPSFGTGEVASYFSDGKKSSYKCMWEMSKNETEVVNEINMLFLADDKTPTMSNDLTEDFEDPFADFFEPERVLPEELKMNVQKVLQNLFFDSVSCMLTDDRSWDFPDSEVGEECHDSAIATAYVYLDEPLKESEQFDAETENRFLIY
jgi:hypothetical protein